MKKEETEQVLAHYVVMEKYTIPCKVVDKGELAIMNYIEEHELDPDCTDNRDWEIV